MTAFDCMLFFLGTGCAIVILWPFFSAYSKLAYMEAEYCKAKDYASLDVHPVEACMIRLKSENDSLRQELFKFVDDDELEDTLVSSKTN